MANLPTEGIWITSVISWDCMVIPLGILRDKFRSILRTGISVSCISLIFQLVPAGDVYKRQTLGWGKSVVETLSRDIQKEFPGIQGFGVRNMWDMARFYSEYQSNEFLQPLVAEISWSKHIVILTKCKDNRQRQFYILATKKFGWTKDVLINKIELETYEKYLLGQNNFDKTLPENIRNQAILAVKDEYTLGFMGRCV